MTPLSDLKNFLLFFFLCGSAQCLIDDSLKPVNIYYFEPPFPNYPKMTEFVEKHKDMTCDDLGIDESCLVINSEMATKTIKFLYASQECDECSLQELASIEPNTAVKKTLEYASLGSVWEVIDEDNRSICREQHYLGENSWYHINVNDTGCFLVCDKEPEPTYLPIIYAIGFYILLALLWIIIKYLQKKEVFNIIFHSNSMDVSADFVATYSSSTSVEEQKKPVQKRLRSLDTVRGLAIVIMIFVNYGGGKYWYFHHAHWNGLTVADLVFPWFIWMMGMSMALSMRSLLRKAVSRRKIFLKILKRSVILFALGIMLNTYCHVVDLDKLRIPGVLQRFSITYFIVATIHLFYASAQDDQNSSLSPFRDITPYGAEWLIMITFLGSHVLLTFLVHSADCPKGYLGPGGLHDQGKFPNCTGGAAGFIDRVILGEQHLYQHPTIKEIYHTSMPYDPEGILGYFTSIFLVFLGLQAGKILITYKESKERLIRWITWSCATGTVAAILCFCSKNDGIIPVNKNLWSVSFIMATGSLAFMLLSICYFVIDVKKIWNGAPFFYAGMNSIMLYVGHEITHKMFPWSWQMRPTHMNELFQDLWGTTLWVLISIYMYHKNFFLAI